MCATQASPTRPLPRPTSPLRGEVCIGKFSPADRLTRISHEADMDRHNLNAGQYLRLSYPNHRVLKPDAQAKEYCEIPSLALQA